MTPKQAQWQLLFLDYYDGVIDGIWGPKSKAACFDVPYTETDEPVETEETTVEE